MGPCCLDKPAEERKLVIYSRIQATVIPDPCVAPKVQVSAPAGSSQSITMPEPGDLGYNDFPVTLLYLKPIDTDGISDPNVKISLKSLSKKNAVTKEKRLTQFLQMLQQDAVDLNDEMVLIAWLQLYPVLAIDSLKTVRLLAHQVQALYVEKYGPKEFSKYFKTSLPTWLQGLFDEKPIALAVRSELLKSFSNDSTKVDLKLWVIFHEQIAHFCHTILLHESANTITDERIETHEELTMKYERAATSAILTLKRLIYLTNSKQLELSEIAQAQLEEILSSEKLWDFLRSSLSPEMLNVSLFRSLAGLIDEVFQLNGDTTLRAFASQLKSMNAVYKMISKKWLKTVKLSASGEPQSTQSLVFSTAILPLFSSLVTLTRVTEIDAAQRNSLKLKKNFWQYGGSKSFSRLKGYLSLGPCNSEPTYYSIVGDLFAAIAKLDLTPTEDLRFVDLSSASDAKTILNGCLLPHVAKLRGPKALLFKLEAVKCLTNVMGNFALSQEQLVKTATPIVVELMDTVAATRVRPEDLKTFAGCTDALASLFRASGIDLVLFSESVAALLDEDLPNKLHDIEFGCSRLRICELYYNILKSISSQASLDFVSELINVSESLSGEESLKLLSLFLTTVISDKETLEIIVPWAKDSLASILSENLVDSPLSILRSILQSPDHSHDTQELVEDMFTKTSLLSSSSVAKLIQTLRSSGYFTTRTSRDLPELHQYLLALASKTTRLTEENDILLLFAAEESVFSKLLATSNDSTSRKRLISAILRLSIDVSFDLKDPQIASMVTEAFININDEESKVFINNFIDAPEMKNIILSTILSTTNPESTKALASFLAGIPEKIPFPELEHVVGDALKEVNFQSLALANPLAQNILLVSQTSKGVFNKDVINIARFLRDYADSSKGSHVQATILLGICLEYLKDNSFLAVIKESDELHETYDECFQKAVALQNVSIAQLYGDLSDSELAAAISQEISGTDSFTPQQYYTARLATIIATPLFENLSLAEFDALPIQYTKLVGHPLKLASFLSSCSKFIGVSPKLDRARNFVFAEILGAKSSSQIISAGKTWLSLATNFLATEEPYVVSPSHKMALLINHLSAWAESDIAYDDEFIPVRTLLAIFLSKLIILQPAELPDKIRSFSIDLCLNNLSTAQTDEDLLALKYHTIKLYVAISNHIKETGDTSWKESLASIQEELVDCMFSSASEAASVTQAKLLVNGLLERVLRTAKFSKAYLASYSQKWFTLLATSQYVSLQRLATIFLRQHIFESQQDSIFESQTKKLKTDQDAPNSMEDSLVQSASFLEIHLEDCLHQGKYHYAARYLWSWLLIFEYFKESSFSMKSVYLSQLAANESIDQLLDVIFETLPVTDQSFLSNLMQSDSRNGKKFTAENSLIQEYNLSLINSGGALHDEMIQVTAYVYFLALKYLGLLVLLWFNNIRDLQLKQQVQTFTVQYASPVLISSMLTNVENATKSLIGGEENLTIKVNKVTNEIKSIYIIDEQTMEMVVKIPNAFPLSGVSVEGPTRLGVKEKQWKAWLLASQRVISLTNGSIVDSIDLFKRNVNLHFSGFEECAICYSILHQDHSLPSKVCPTCLNKFHAACLYKWFKSSGSSTCPLCRSTFNFNSSR